MSGDVDGEGAQILTELDAVGNTTKAITKGIAIATAVLAATALFGSYSDAVGRPRCGTVGQDRGADAVVQSMLRSASSARTPSSACIIGAAVVFLFSGLAINAVTRAAGAIVFEVRRQFREHPGIMDGTEKPEYGRVVDICTRDSLRELATPGLLAALAPIAVGFGLGIGPLAGYLAGAIGTGVPHGRLPGELRWRRGTTRRRSSRTATTAARAPTRTRPPSSATPSATRSRTPPARRSTR